MKAGSCPVPVRTVMCTTIPSQICDDDAFCPNDQKCCAIHQGCKPICVNPVGNGGGVEEREGEKEIEREREREREREMMMMIV